MNNYKDIIKEKYRKILFIHGWGFTRQIWSENFDYTTSNNCIFIDLYDHIESTQGNLKEAAKKIINEYGNFDLIISWSLGCLLAKEIESLVNKKLKKIIFISYNPQFLKDSSWIFGLDQYQVNELKKNLLIDKELTIKNFYLLVLGEIENKKKYYKRIYKNIKSILDIDTSNLILALEVLEKYKYKNFKKNSNIKKLYIFGEEDLITPIDIADIIRKNEPNSLVKIIKDSSHIPFVTNGTQFNEILKEFL